MAAVRKYFSITDYLEAENPHVNYSRMILFVCSEFKILCGVYFEYA